MRLIDADVLIKAMEEKCDYTAELDPIILSVVRGAVKTIPTAYDVEKVVEEEKVFLVNYGVPENTAVHRKIIDIVRKGGIKNE